MGTYGRRNDENWSERGRNGCRVRILTIGIMKKCSAWLGWERSLVNCNDHLDSNGLSVGKVLISNHWLSSLSSFQGGICCITLVSERKHIGSSANRGCYGDWQEVIVRDEVPPLGGLSQYIDRRGIALRVIRTGMAQRRAEKGFDPSNISQPAFYWTQTNDKGQSQEECKEREYSVTLI